MEFQRRFLPIPKQSFFLFGPRGTGKSTWLRHLFPEALFFDLLQPDVYREMSARPERLRELVLGSPQQATVVVDEVQRVPELLNVVHALIEQPVPRQFVLTDGVVDERLDASEARLIDLLGGGDVRTEEQNQAGGGKSDGGHWLDYTDGSTSPSAVGP